MTRLPALLITTGLLLLAVSLYKLWRMTDPLEERNPHPAAFPFVADARGRMELDRVNGRNIVLPKEWER